MLEIARQLERTAVWFSPVVLIGPGLVCVLLGLFLWLGGLGFRRTLVATIGAIIGGICGFFMSGRKIVTAMITAAVAAVLAVKLEKIFIAILAGVLASILCFAVLIRPDSGIDDAGYHSESENVRMSLDTELSIEIAKRHLADFAAETKRMFSHMPIYYWALIEVIAAFFFVVGFARQRLTSAFCCAVLGTMFVFTGMILLLLYKGAAPISRICQNRFAYQGVFGVMVAFGIAVQLLLCPRIQDKLARKKGNGKDGNAPEETGSWRNR